MDILIDQDTSMNTIAALSAIAVSKTDNNHTAINRHVQTDIVKGGLSSLDLNDVPTNGSFNNLPPCDPVEIYFKDLSYSVQKMFSKS
jgi:hypothetical protein